MELRPVAELVSKESAWPAIQTWISEARNQITVLPASEPGRSEALQATQVTTRSPLGSIIYETGGILIDNGWLRILGSGSDKMPRSLPTWNTEINGGKFGADGFILIADDVIGGFYALNGGGLSGPSGNVFYFAPDTLVWEDLSIPYTGFLQLAFDGDLETYYKAFRWSGWQAEVSALKGDQAYSVFPFYFTEHADTKRDRKVVPVAELYELLVIYWPNEIEKKGLQPGQQVKIQISRD